MYYLSTPFGNLRRCCCTEYFPERLISGTFSLRISGPLGVKGHLTWVNARYANVEKEAYVRIIDADERYVAPETGTFCRHIVQRNIYAEEQEAHNADM